MSFRNILLVKSSKIAAGGNAASDPIPLGLEYIAAYIQNCVNRIDIIDFAKDSKSIKYYLKKLKPDLVGVSINYSMEHTESLEIAKESKKSGASVVVGGYHATGLAEELAANPFIDFVVRGEGEETMRELVENGAPEEIKGISFSKNGKIVHNPDRPLIKELDAIPYPARNLRKYKYQVPLLGKELDVITISRGCWAKCKFCCEPMMCKGIQRYRKPEEIVKELEEILKLRKHKDIFIGIYDSNFGGDPKITKEFCDRLIEFKSKNNLEFKLGAPARVDVFGTNKELVEKAIKAGIYIFNIGIESSNEKHLKLMNKDSTNDLQKRGIENVKKNRGKVFGTFLVGFPYQTEADILDCLNYAKQLGLEYPAFGIFTPLPGSELYKEFKTEGLIIEKNWEKYDCHNLVFKHKYFTNLELRKLLSKILFNVYNDLFLENEYKELMLTKKKKRLYEFGITTISTLNMGVSTLIKDNEDLTYLKETLREFTNSNLKTFSREKGLHNIFEMRRFLKILGKQEIQITFNINNKPIVSWLIKTTKHKVEYINVKENKFDKFSVIINTHLEDAIKNKSLQGMYGNILKCALKDNKGLCAKINLLRLLTAIGSELLAYKLS